MSVLLFLALVVLATIPVQIAIARSGQPLERMPIHVITLMWIPALASVVVRLLRREGFDDVSFRWGSRSTWYVVGIVVAYPTIVGAVAYGAAWLTGLAKFQGTGPTFAINPTSSFAQFALRYAACLLPGIPLSLITAFGEELGWRGFFVLRLIEAGVPRPLLLSGLVWGLWHVPLILTGQYATGPSPMLSSLVFVVSIVPAAYLFGWARLVTGSVWPAAIAHAAWNSIIQGAFDRATAETNIWTGESGVLVATISVVAAWAIIRKPFEVRSRPRDPSEG